jgi:hypothetical protein
MIRPRRTPQIPSRYRTSSPPRPIPRNGQQKRRRIDPENIDRNDVDQALAVIAAAPKSTDELPTLIPTGLPHFEANYVQNRPGRCQYFDLSD